MKPCLLTGLVSLCLASHLLADAPPGAVEWVQQHAIPFATVSPDHGVDDLQGLRPIIGDARIVSLGESTHGSKEIFQMKHRLLEFLVREMGFTIFSIEASMPEAYRLNEYVLHGEGDPKQLIGGMYFRTWNTDEVLAMVNWMREYNQTAERPVQFTGFDMQTPDVAMAHVLEWVQTHHPDQYAGLEQTYQQARQIKRGGRNADTGVALGSFPVEDAAGKQLRLSGWIKTDNVQGFAGLWWRVDGKDGVLAFENMFDESVRGTTDWKQYQFELEIPTEIVNINFGVLQFGTGTSWFDGIKVELDGQLQEELSRELDFESDTLHGLSFGRQPGYTQTLDTEHAKVGKQSLKIAAETGELTAEQREQQREEQQQILRQMQEAIELLQADRQPGSQPQVDLEWAIQNARVAYQAIALRAGELRRDAAMAENAAWILEQNPDAKLVLWAHNGHVSRMVNMMGWHLDQQFESSYRPIGFATAKGNYQGMVMGEGLSVHPLQAPPAGSVEAVFAETGLPLFILDLRSIPADAPVTTLLTQPVLFRTIGAIAQDNQFFPANLQQSFDAVIFIEETTATEPIGGRPQNR